MYTPSLAASCIRCCSNFLLVSLGVSINKVQLSKCFIIRSYNRRRVGLSGLNCSPVIMAYAGPAKASINDCGSSKSVGSLCSRLPNTGQRTPVGIGRPKSSGTPASSSSSLWTLHSSVPSCSVAQTGVSVLVALASECSS
ncbi:hypothetical protein PF008_g404 [Phytophthora fragariae]|uniref:Uncharacterized protein n=1 Tax=Phytophthora fragariae TaxID=53985 RepID=A0A6G0SNP9_9STRA|nr:hypothetical protein PF008_g404 [Phytophthora fragariae]